ncbi:MAG: tyrosine-type recombinase/integrase [Defluviicoccus sp.]|jgi:integrase|nr:tyrosine-type recombinase/integrase [Defluviicoccus sp.]
MLRRDIERYVALHQARGFKFSNPCVLLRSFVAFAEERGDEYLKVDRVLEWAVRAPSAPQRRCRLDILRRFALEMSAEGGRHEVPPRDAFGRGGFKRRPPHIYRSDEIRRLVDAALALNPAGSIRPLMYATLFGLLVSTGLRISEALNLRLNDVTTDGLLINETKFRKSRLVPIHGSTHQALDRYLLARTKLGHLDGHVFVTTTGRRPSYATVRDTFRILAKTAGLGGQPERRHPRIHDLRHTFAVRSLEACVPDRTSVSRHIAALSTYLGHCNIESTYWYLEATPVLLKQIADATELAHQGGML